MNCTHCKTKLVFRTPQKTKRAGVDVLRLKCPGCGELFLATDSKFSHPYQTHPTRKKDIKKVRSFRASDKEMELIENGKLTLTVINKRITIAV